MRSILAATAVVLAVRIIAATPSLADEQDDIAVAESLISEIKMKLEADKRAYDRAINALAATEEGKRRMATCRDRNTTYWGACLHSNRGDDQWKFRGAYQPLYDWFYEQELNALKAAEAEASLNGGSN